MKNNQNNNDKRQNSSSGNKPLVGQLVDETNNAPAKNKNIKTKHYGNPKPAQKQEKKPQQQNSTRKNPSSPDRKQNPKGKNPTQNIMRHNGTPKNLKVMFLGGVGEIGKNMTVFEYGDSIVVIDAGMTFPTNNMPGVDVVIPDMTYLVENRSKIKGILITHGHEDHVGAVPFLVQKLGGKLDIYGTRLTLGLVENKLNEYGLLKSVNAVSIADKSVAALGDFTAEFIHVSHSVAGSVAICLRTPAGTVLHTGDFKIDYTPLGNEIMNLNRIAEIGQEGVMLLMSESTNAEKPGYTMSESVVENTMNKLFSEAKGRRIIIATFASNIDRIGMILELAALYKRKIAVSGRSMVSRIETAARVGYVKFDKSMFVDIDDINKIDDGKLVILSTGSQGEPMSALTRMASGEFNKVKIGINDTIIISATPIPGNERDVYTVVNNLYRLGALVVYSTLADVHVSGHACQEELKLIYTLVKPRYFVPVHGEYRHLRQHAMLVEKLGHKHSNIFLPDIGDCLEVSNNVFKLSGKVAGGSVMVDGLGVGDVGNLVLKDRMALAEDGIVSVALCIDRDNKSIVSGPELISRGCFFNGDEGSQGAIAELKKHILSELNAIDKREFNVNTIKATIARTARHDFKVKLKRFPVVLPIVLEK
jgi:ribonuclease J